MRGGRSAAVRVLRPPRDPLPALREADRGQGRLRAARPGRAGAARRRQRRARHAPAGGRADRRGRAALRGRGRAALAAHRHRAVPRGGRGDGGRGPGRRRHGGHRRGRGGRVDNRGRDRRAPPRRPGPGAAGRVLRGARVRPDGGDGGRRPGPADRALPRRLPAAGGREGGHGARPDLPGARPRAAVPGRAPDPPHGRPGVPRAHGAAGPPGRLAVVAGHLADGPALVAHGGVRDATRPGPGRLRSRGGPVRAGAGALGLRTLVRRPAGAGAGPRRRAGRRLPDPRDAPRRCTCATRRRRPPRRRWPSPT